MNQSQKSEVKSQKSTLGFTLVELIVVITVLAILSSVGIASFVEGSRNAELQTVQDKIVTMLSVAKSRSLSQTSPSTGCSGSLQGYGVLFLTKAKICLYAVCKNGPISFNPPLDCENTVETYTFPTNVTIDNNPLPGPFYFPILSGTVEGLGSPVQINIAGYGKQKSIMLNPNGVISTEVAPTPSK